jgi:hypothetical protein
MVEPCARRGVLSLSRLRAQLPRLQVDVGEERVEEGRLSDTGVPDEDGRGAGDDLAQLLDAGSRVRADTHVIERDGGLLERAANLLLVAEVDLVETENRVEPSTAREEPPSIHESGAERRLDDRGDDHGVGGVRGDDLRPAAGIVRGALEPRPALADPDDAGGIRATRLDHHFVADREGIRVAGVHQRLELARERGLDEHVPVP